MLKIPFRVSTTDYQGKRVNPHIGPLLKAIPFKLFLDIVPSSSEDVTRAMHGQLKRLSQNYPRGNGGNVIYMFWFRFIPEMFSALSATFL